MNREIPADSVGLVKTKYFTFGSEAKPLKLDSGRELGPVTLAYETYGRLNRKKTNAVLILHALSGSAHAAGYHSPDDKNPGWWETYIGPGKAFDTEKYFIICSNVIGGCSGSTGPASENPLTGKPYALDFPLVTIDDMVRAQKELVDSLGIEKLLSVAGGSMGGMQALSWSIQYSEKVNSVIAVATSGLVSAQAIAFNEVGRQAIVTDPNWNGGSYYGDSIPATGLSIARMIGHITYLSEQNLHDRFGRNFQDADPDAFSFNTQYMVGSYLRHQGDKFVDRFDANSYLYITRAIDMYDLKKSHGNSLIEAFEKVTSDYMIISFTSDWLFPSGMSRDIVKALRSNGKNVAYTDIETDKGHDSFLLPSDTMEDIIRNFLKSEFNRINARHDKQE